MKRSSLAIGVAVLVAFSTVMFGASAFTSATVTRDQTIKVVADDSGPIALNDGSTGISKLTSDGELEISVEKLSSVGGVNPNATYTFGNETAINSSSSSPNSDDYVFSITNNGQDQHDVTIQYTASDSDVGTKNLNFTVMKADQSTGNKKTVQVGTGEDKTITLSSGETWYVVVEFNTGLHGANDITNSSDLGGTLKITV